MCTKCGKRKTIVFRESFRISIASGLVEHNSDTHNVCLCIDCLRNSAKISFSNENENFIRGLVKGV